MQEINRLKQLRDQILGIEMNLSLINSDLIAINADIKYLEDLALILKENIDVLKSANIIAVATEYKIATTELKTVRENLIFYNRTKQDLLANKARHDKLRDASIIEYEDLKKHIDSRKVILLFDPNKRKK